VLPQEFLSVIVALPTLALGHHLNRCQELKAWCHHGAPLSEVKVAEADGGAGNTRVLEAEDVRGAGRARARPGDSSVKVSVARTPEQGPWRPPGWPGAQVPRPSSVDCGDRS
jgi:hypothetical protein